MEADLSILWSTGNTLFKSYFALNAGNSSLKYCEQKLSIVDTSAAAFSNLLSCKTFWENQHSLVSVITRLLEWQEKKAFFWEHNRRVYSSCSVIYDNCWHLVMSGSVLSKKKKKNQLKKNIQLTWWGARAPRMHANYACLPSGTKISHLIKCAR